MNKTPLETIRSYCLYCNGGNSAEVRRCDADGKTSGFDPCPFHPYRMGRGRPSVKIIRKFCLECMGGNRDIVTTCTTSDCLCYPYRMGKNPAYAGRGRTKEEMRAMRSAIKGKYVQNQRSANGHRWDNGNDINFKRLDNRG